MKQFPNAHLWLLLPFAIAIIGFYFSYWSVFSQAEIRQHTHGLSATAWFVFLILQPWLYHNKPISYHRKAGFIGLFMAGGVFFSAVNSLPYNLIVVIPDNFPVWNKYGITFHNVSALVGFTTAVIMAMMNSKNVSLHARWMISTAIWVLQPAAIRIVFIPILMIYGNDIPFAYHQLWYGCLVVSVTPLLIMIYLDYRRENKIYTPYLFTLIGVTLGVSLYEMMGTSQWWINLCDAVLLNGFN